MSPWLAGLCRGWEFALNVCIVLHCLLCARVGYTVQPMQYNLQEAYDVSA
jgi:hypothetical protein